MVSCARLDCSPLSSYFIFLGEKDAIVGGGLIRKGLVLTQVCVHPVNILMVNDKEYAFGA